MIERIVHAGEELALIVRRGFRGDGIEFFTAAADTLQLGHMGHPAGHVVAPHVHNPVPRQVEHTREVLVLRSGRVRLDFYDPQRHYLESTVLEAGDIVLLARGGHGLEVLEAADLVEIKQGPHAGDRDKTRFEPVEASRIAWRPAP
jgi:hypothetical protein